MSSKNQDLVLIEEEASANNNFCISREIILKSWLFNNNTEFFWPPGVSEKVVEDMVMDRVKPDPKTWDRYRVRKILHASDKFGILAAKRTALNNTDISSCDASMLSKKKPTIKKKPKEKLKKKNSVITSRGKLMLKTASSVPPPKKIFRCKNSLKKDASQTETNISCQNRSKYINSSASLRLLATRNLNKQFDAEDQKKSSYVGPPSNSSQFMQSDYYAHSGIDYSQLHQSNNLQSYTSINTDFQFHESSNLQSSESVDKNFTDVVMTAFGTQETVLENNPSNIATCSTYSTVDSPVSNFPVTKISHISENIPTCSNATNSIPSFLINQTDHIVGNSTTFTPVSTHGPVPSHSPNPIHSPVPIYNPVPIYDSVSTYNPVATKLTGQTSRMNESSVALNPVKILENKLSANQLLTLNEIGEAIIFSEKRRSAEHRIIKKMILDINAKFTQIGSRTENENNACISSFLMENKIPIFDESSCELLNEHLEKGDNKNKTIEYLKDHLKQEKSTRGRTITAAVRPFVLTDITMFYSWGGKEKPGRFRTTAIGECLISAYMQSYTKSRQQAQKDLAEWFKTFTQTRRRHHKKNTPKKKTNEGNHTADEERSRGEVL